MCIVLFCPCSVPFFFIFYFIKPFACLDFYPCKIKPTVDFEELTYHNDEYVSTFIFTGARLRTPEVRLSGQVCHRGSRLSTSPRACSAALLPPEARHQLMLRACQRFLANNAQPCLCCLRVSPRTSGKTEWQN